MKSETTYAKCSCRNCGGHLEFQVSSAGQTVACPHCGMETVLFIPQPASSGGSNSMNTEASFSQCHCHLCGGGIEFPIEAANQWITCPHCGKETVLVVPAAPPAEGFWRRLIKRMRERRRQERLRKDTLAFEARRAPAEPASPLTACGDCGREISIRAAACPHCGAPGLGAPTVPAVCLARIESKGETFGVGCLLQLLGLVVLFMFPVGTVFGLAFLIWGHCAAYKRICGNCGNELSSKSVKLCPACKAQFL